MLIPTVRKQNLFLSLVLELILGDTLAHGAGAADAARDHLEQVVGVIGAGPFLMRDDFDAALHLGLLNELAIGAHALLRVSFAEGIGHERRLVEASQSDELPAVALKEKKR